MGRFLLITNPLLHYSNTPTLQNSSTKNTNQNLKNANQNLKQPQLQLCFFCHHVLIPGRVKGKFKINFGNSR